MLREDFTLEEFGKIFQAFNDAVYRGDAKKLAYKSWKNINAWAKGKYEKMRVRKEIVRYENEFRTFSEKEIILVGPWDSERVCPNPEELNPNDGSLGSWLDGVLVRESLMALNSCCSDTTNNVAYISATATSLREAMESLQSGICTLNDSSDCYYSTGTDWEITSTPRYELKSDNLYIDGKPFDEYLQTFTNKKEENKEMMKFDFGPVNSNVRMSMYGMAIKNANGTYVAYDVANNSIMDVDILNFEGADKLFYKMPVAVGAVRSGDIVIHMGKPMFVSAVLVADGRFKVLDIWSGEEKTIVPTRSPFGFEFMTKIVSLMDFGNANKDNPFGNMLPLLLLNDSNSKDNTALMMAMMYGHTDMMKNPMLMYALMSKDGKMNDMLPFL